MGYIFISYSRQQLYFAEAVALHIQKAGIEAWFDLQQLSPGVNWPTALKEGYGNCDQLVFVASEAALASPYVQVEWETALRNGREIIVVLTEPVTLPDALRACPVYDARTHFDRSVQRLIGYLRGELPAAHDPVPAPGKRSILSQKMPFDIWFTVCVMLLPTLTIWITIVVLILVIPLSSVNIEFALPDYLEKYRSGIKLLAVILFGGSYGLNLAMVQIPVREFIRHEVPYKELTGLRWKLLRIVLSASAISLFFAVLVPGINGQLVNPIGYLIFLFPLFTAYWSFWMLGNSADILRWLPSGQADQDVRERIQSKLVADVEEGSSDETIAPELEVATYAIHHHPADAYTAKYIESALHAGGCQPAPEGQAAIQLIIVSNRTSKGWLIERNAALTGQIIHILATNINTPPEIQPLLQAQWVDFRTGREKILQALAAHLTNKDETNANYALQISPTGFDSSHNFPRISVLFAIFLVIFMLAFVGISRYLNLPDWTILLLGMLLGLPLILYFIALLMRKRPIPSLLHKTLGHHVAWFASPAPHAHDAIGNMHIG